MQKQPAFTHKHKQHTILNRPALNFQDKNHKNDSNLMSQHKTATAETPLRKKCTLIKIPNSTTELLILFFDTVKCFILNTFPVTLKMQTHTLLAILCRRSIDSGWFRDPLDADGCMMPGDVRDAFAEMEAKIWQILNG